MKIIKAKYFYSILLSILVIGCFAVLPAFSSMVYYKDLFGVLFCVYFILPLLVIKKSDSSKIRLFKIIIVLLPATFIYLVIPLFIINLHALPLGLSVTISGVLGYILFKKNYLLKLVMCFGMILLGIYGYPKYSREISHQQSQINEPLNSELVFNDDVIQNSIQWKNNKLVILEFWNSACGQCIKDFPKFQEFYNKNKNKYEIYSVNVPWRRDKDKNFNPKQFVDSLGFDFPILSMEFEEANKIGINFFPTVLVIGDETIKYNGQLNYSQSGRYSFIEILKEIEK